MTNRDPLPYLALCIFDKKLWDALLHCLGRCAEGTYNSRRRLFDSTSCWSGVRHLHSIRMGRQ